MTDSGLRKFKRRQQRQHNNDTTSQDRQRRRNITLHYEGTATDLADFNSVLREPALWAALPPAAYQEHKGEAPPMIFFRYPRKVMAWACNHAAVATRSRNYRYYCSNLDRLTPCQCLGAQFAAYQLTVENGPGLP